MVTLFSGYVTTRAAESGATIRFRSAAEARQAIVSAEIEPYFSLLTPLDMAVKAGSPLPEGTPDAQRDAFRQRYAEAVLDFTDEEKALLRDCIERVQPILVEHYPLAARTPWSLIKKADWLEGGSHFTRERHIVLSERFLSRVVARKDDADKDALVAGVLGLLLHEQTHVLQRLHPRVFAKMYAELWSMKHVDKIEGDEWLRERQLVNPDAVDVNWVMALTDEATGRTRVVWPRIVLTKTQWPIVMFRDAAMVLVELEQTTTGYRVKLDADGVPVQTPLPKDAEFIKHFPHGNAYHPNEAAAALWSAIVLGDLFPMRAHRSAAAISLEERARPWLREAFKVAAPSK